MPPRSLADAVMYSSRGPSPRLSRPPPDCRPGVRMEGADDDTKDAASEYPLASETFDDIPRSRSRSSRSPRLVPPLSFRRLPVLGSRSSVPPRGVLLLAAAPPDLLPRCFRLPLVPSPIDIMVMSFVPRSLAPKCCTPTPPPRRETDEPPALDEGRLLRGVDAVGVPAGVELWQLRGVPPFWEVPRRCPR